jgi:hypothetical protein
MGFLSLRACGSLACSVCSGTLEHPSLADLLLVWLGDFTPAKPQIVTNMLARLLNAGYPLLAFHIPMLTKGTSLCLQTIVLFEKPLS